MGGVVLDVSGPFKSAIAARAAVEPKNRAQRGSTLFGEVHAVTDHMDRDGSAGMEAREQARRVNVEMRAALAAERQ